MCLWHSVLVDNHGILAIRLDHRRDLFSTVSKLEEAGFARIIDYSILDSNSNNKNNHEQQQQQHQLVLVAFTDRDDVARWHLNEALWNLELRLRLKNNDKNDMPGDYNYFLDAATMVTLEYPPKQSAIEYCLNDDDDDCDNHRQRQHGFDPHAWNVPKDLLTVGKSTAGEHAGRGVFAMTPIPNGSYLNLEVSAHPVRAHWKTTDIILRLGDANEIYDDENTLYSYLDGYGYIDEPWVSFIFCCVCVCAIR
jgi:hypothetical protein